MSVIDTLVFDRTQTDVDYIRTLNNKGLVGMSTEERESWEKGGAEPLEAIDEALEASDGMLYVIGSGAIRGAYNFTDLNRVESAVRYIANSLKQTDTDMKSRARALGVAWGGLFDLPYDPNGYDLTVKTDWARVDEPRTADMERYLYNIRLLTTAFEAQYPDIPNDMNGLQYTGANAIEQTLYIVYTALLDEIDRIERLLNNTAAGFIYSGQPYSGMVWEQFAT